MVGLIKHALLLVTLQPWWVVRLQKSVMWTVY